MKTRPRYPFRLCPKEHSYEVKKDQARFECPQCGAVGGCQFRTRKQRAAFRTGDLFDETIRGT